MSRAVQVRAAAVFNRAEYCRCTTVQNCDYDRAAEKLGCKRRFLEDRISHLPHQKFGESVAFCDCELAIIQALFSVLPTSVEPALNQGTTAPTSADTPAATLRSIRPSQGRKRGA